MESFFVISACACLRLAGGGRVGIREQRIVIQGSLFSLDKRAAVGVD